MQILKTNKIKKQNELNNKMVNDFTSLFINLNNREPMESEIIDNLKDKVDINTIKKIIDENKSTSFTTNIEDRSNAINIV